MSVGPIERHTTNQLHQHQAQGGGPLQTGGARDPQGGSGSAVQGVEAPPDWYAIAGQTRPAGPQVGLTTPPEQRRTPGGETLVVDTDAVEPARGSLSPSRPFGSLRDAVRQALRERAAEQGQTLPAAAVEQELTRLERAALSELSAADMQLLRRVSAAPLAGALRAQLDALGAQLEARHVVPNAAEALLLLGERVASRAPHALDLLAAVRAGQAAAALDAGASTTSLPAPALSVDIDPQNGSTRLAWNPREPGSPQVKGYKLYLGTASRSAAGFTQYEHRGLDLGSVPLVPNTTPPEHRYDVTALLAERGLDGREVFFTLTAYNDGHESTFSNEVSKKLAGTLRGDVDGRGQVELKDFAQQLEQFARRAPVSPGADLSGDGSLDRRDLRELLAQLLKPSHRT